MSGLLHRLLLLFLLAQTVHAEPGQLGVHDPVLARDGERFYLFSTGPGITFYSSTDLVHWRHEGRVFATEPAWARSVAPEFNGHLWAPDIIHHRGLYYLYYSVSAFGKNTSAIGVTVSESLDPRSPRYGWRDRGIVLQSVPNRDLWNAIDSAVIFDEVGQPWLSFGSFWGGLKLVRLQESMDRLAQPESWYTLAKRERPALSDDRLPGPAELEAPFLYQKNGYYYLFVSWDRCCQGADSTYKMMVGRARDLRGPYLDREGRSLAEGGGSLLLAGDASFAGVGHNAVYDIGGREVLVCHAYETADQGRQKLKILTLNWDQEGWPTVSREELHGYRSVALPAAPRP